MLPLVDGGAAYDLTKTVALGMMCLFLTALLLKSPLLQDNPEEQVEDPVTDALGRWARDERARRAFSALLVIVAVVISAAYFSKSSTYERYLHRWDAYHTVLGAKYHDELGYFDLYKCSIAIDKKGAGHFAEVKNVRDLRTRQVVSTKEHLRGNDCLKRFTPERLAEFQEDLNILGASMKSSDWQRLFRDKGFNGTPFYTVVATALLAVFGTSLEQLTKLAFLDVILMLSAFASVGWAFGVRRAAIFAIFFCCFFPNRYVHMGGSILRFDYVATLAIALSALKKDKWGLAGVLMAWAGMVRIFPLVFAGAVLLKIAVEFFATRRLERKHMLFVSAFSLGMFAFLMTSFIGLDGALDDWREWWLNMKVHNKTSASFRIGFRHLFMLDGSMERVKYGAMQGTFGARIGFYVGVAGLLMSPLLLSIRRLDVVTFAALFGAVGFFLSVIATRYYYSVFTLVFLVDRDIFRNRTLLILCASLFGFSAFDYFYFETYDNTALMYNFILGAQLATFVVLLNYGLLFDLGLQEGALSKVDTTSDAMGAPDSSGAQDSSVVQDASVAEESAAPPEENAHAAFLPSGSGSTAGG
jgi:hypothetical protein